MRFPPCTGSQGTLSLSPPFQLNCDPEAAFCLLQVHVLSTAHGGYTPCRICPHDFLDILSLKYQVSLPAMNSRV